MSYFAVLLCIVAVVGELSDLKAKFMHRKPRRKLHQI